MCFPLRLWDVADLHFIGHADYPWFEIYPGHVSAGENDVATSRVAPLLQRVYPQFDICRLIGFLAIPFSHATKTPQYIRTLISTAQVPTSWQIKGSLSRSCCPHNTPRSIRVSPGIFPNTAI
jgi:hypothetical protein